MKATFRIWRGDKQGGAFKDYPTEITEGMVVLDAVHKIQAERPTTWPAAGTARRASAARCSAEINGMPKLMCMTRLNELPLEQPVTIEPMKAFPLIRDLVTDVSWNYEVKKTIKKFKPRPPDAADGTWRMQQEDIERVQEFRKCIECFICQDVCHVLRDHQQTRASSSARASSPTPPRWRCTRWTREDRVVDLKEQHGIGYCNITKCCTKVCPEEITITDNAIIPLKERVVDRLYDPITRLLRVFKRERRRR